MPTCSCTTRNRKDGQILEEGITEAGSMASFTAAGTAYANYGVPMIPFFIYYSMFGFQRVGDLIWAFADSRGKGFLMGGTAGRTTLAGEGLQHQDGHSLVLASTVPTCATYDPAYAYEIAVIVQDGIRRMYQEHEDRFYYLTLYNENYASRRCRRAWIREGILQGHLPVQGRRKRARPRCSLFGSGPILNEALRAQQILAEKYSVAADVWSVTSYNELRRDALDVERWNRLHPDEPARTPYIAEGAEGRRGPDHRGQRLHEGGGRPDCAVAAGPPGDAGHRRLRPQRESRVPAAALRDQRGIHRRRRAFAPGARWQVRRQEGRRRLRRTGRGNREDRPGAGLDPRALMQIGQRVAVAGMLVCGALAVDQDRRRHGRPFHRGGGRRPGIGRRRVRLRLRAVRPDPGRQARR